MHTMGLGKARLGLVAATRGRMGVLVSNGFSDIFHNIIGLLWKFLEPYTDAHNGAESGQVGWRQHGEGRGSLFLMGFLGIFHNIIGLLWKFLEPYIDGTHWG